MVAQLVEALHYKSESCGFDSGRTLVLGSTQPLTEMNTRCICWGGKGGWRVGLTTLSAALADCLEIGELQPWYPWGLSRQ